jgi:dTDP-4-dehydrorhamnose reductase
MKILVTGGDGQLAFDLKRVFSNDKVWLAPKELFNITNESQITKELNLINPDVLINTAAFHNVEECEKNPFKALQINFRAPEMLASICKKRKIKFVHISTDYAVNPVNFYGVSKMIGEDGVLNENKNALIVRTSGLFGVKGPHGKPNGNFVDLMIKLAKEGKDIKVVNDQTFSPTYTLDLAKGIKKAISRDASGIINITNLGECTWFDLAVFVINKAGVKASVLPQTTEESGAKVARPKHSVLFPKTYCSRPWQEAVDLYLKEKHGVDVK